MRKLFSFLGIFIGLLISVFAIPIYLLKLASYLPDFMNGFLFVLLLIIGLFYLLFICAVCVVTEEVFSMAYIYYFEFEIIRVQNFEGNKFEFTIKIGKKILKVDAVIEFVEKKYSEQQLKWYLIEFFYSNSASKRDFYEFLKKNNFHSVLELNLGLFIIHFSKPFELKAKNFDYSQSAFDF